MNRIIIPRRDHEVYFIPLPERLKPKLIRSFVVGQMEKMHPGFSAETALDIKRLVLDKTRWAMATVMEAETLAEYRVLHKGSAVHTHTSIAVQGRDFTQGGVQTVEDELIGYDSEKKSPVSIPLESGKAGGAESPPKALKTLRFRSGVFTRSVPAWRVTVMIVLMLALFPLFFFPSARKAKVTDMVPFFAAKEEPARESKHTPPAIEILSIFSADLAITGGKITRWQYSESRYSEGQNNEVPAPLVVIEMRGIDVLSIRKIFNQYLYVVLEDITDVRYIDGEPYLTALLDTAGKGYVAPHSGTFSPQGFSLPIFSDLTNELRRHEISVVSETLPSAENGNAFYTVTYTAKDRALVSSMEIITAICDKYPVRVKGMDISIVDESSLFAVVCTLAQSDAPRYGATGEEKTQIPRDSIPKAFGYKETPPPPPPVEVIARTQAPQTQTPQTPQKLETMPEVSIVGTIRDERGQILFYREAGDNKIIIKDTP